MSRAWPRIRRDGPAKYVIRVRGIPSASLVRESWVVGVEVRADGTTVLNGTFADQPDVLGFLRALIGAGHVLVSVECLG